MLVRLSLLLLLALPANPRAGPCEAAAAIAEAAQGVPPGLLAAIGVVESGRRGLGVSGSGVSGSGVSGLGGVTAWPYAVNAAGQGYFPDNAAAAVALVTSLQARGVRSIDVGCFQVNLLHHPAAFAMLAQGFDADANAAAAAGLLHGLRAGAPGWPDAVARYHSATPGLGWPYWLQVAGAWGGTPSGRPSQVAALVRVIVPQMAAALAAPQRNAGVRLPVVITPSRPVL